MTAASYGKTEKALALLEEFQNRYLQANLLRAKEMGPAIAEAREALKKIKVGLANQCYENKKYQEMTRHVQDTLAIDRYYYHANLLAAICYEFSGNRYEAKRFTQIAENNPLPGKVEHKFNKAYFALAESDYQNAIRIYNEIPTEITINAGQIRIFLSDKYTSTKDPVFLFGEGVVAIKWHDKKAGKKILKEFVAKAKRENEHKYQPLIEKAEEMRR